MNAAAILLSVILLLYFISGYYLQGLLEFLQRILKDFFLLELTLGNINAVAYFTLWSYGKIIAPTLMVAFIIALLINFLQVGALFAPEVIRPKFSNINPEQGLKRIVSKRAIVELGKALGKVIVVGSVGYFIVMLKLEELLFYMDMSVSEIWENATGLIFLVAAGALALFVPIGVLDYLFQKSEFHRRQKMTRHEVKEEFKQTEGDPQIKARRKEKQKEVSRIRMMANVEKATVVVTNPEHLAVALYYETGITEAPRLVAKGVRLVAEKIVETARLHNVSVVQNRKIARFIFRSVKIGQEIPPEMYQAVAEILAVVYRQKNTYSD